MLTKFPQPPQGFRILVVDDCEEDRQLLAGFLRRQGYRMYLGVGGRDAIEKARYLLPDLILMDIRMPECDGLSACRLLKADPKTAAIPLIFLTAADSPEERVQGLSEGAVDYIGKPFNLDEIRLRVSIHLHGAHHSAPVAARAAANEIAAPGVSVDAVVFRAAQRLLLDNLAETPELTGLARAVGTNTRRLSDAFRQYAGTTVFDFLRAARMEEARRRLAETSLEIQVIANDLGFGNPASFSTSFRERFGMSPRQYRNACSRLEPEAGDEPRR